MDLPPFLQGAEYIGSVSDLVDTMLVKNTKLCMNTSSPTAHFDVGLEKQSEMITTSSNKRAFIQNNFGEINRIKKTASNEVSKLYKYIIDKKFDAWKCIKSDGKEYYVANNGTAAMWVCLESETQQVENDKTKFIKKYQIGTYSSAGNILGISSYNFTTFSTVTASILAYIIVHALSILLASAIDAVAETFLAALVSGAQAVGLPATFAYAAASLTGFIIYALITIIIFFGILYAWDFINRKYYINVNIYNWDKKETWIIDKCVEDNAVTSSQTKVKDIVLPPASPSTFTPPGFKPLTPLEELCFYVSCTWTNDSTFLQGLGMYVRFRKDNEPNTGFMWAFDCPRFGDNKHGAKNTPSHLGNYSNNAKFSDSPLNFQIALTDVKKTRVSFGLDALSGADNNTYNVLINIDF